LKSTICDFGGAGPPTLRYGVLKGCFVLEINSVAQVVGPEARKGESITLYTVRSLDPTRVPSPRQLPTNHDPAVAARGYQLNKPSHLPLALSPALHFH